MPAEIFSGSDRSACPDLNVFIVDWFSFFFKMSCDNCGGNTLSLFIPMSISWKGAIPTIREFGIVAQIHIIIRFLSQYFFHHAGMARDGEDYEGKAKLSETAKLMEDSLHEFWFEDRSLASGAE